MKNLIKRLGSGRGSSRSSGIQDNEGSNDEAKQSPKLLHLRKTSKRYLRQQQQRQLHQTSEQRKESRSDSRSPSYQNEHHHVSDSEARDSFHFSNGTEQSSYQQPRHQNVFRSSGASYEHASNLFDMKAIQQQLYQHFISWPQQHQQHQQQRQPNHHEHNQRDFEHVGFAHSTSSLSFYGPFPSPDNRPPPSLSQKHQFEFGSSGFNNFNPDARVRFFSEESAMSSFSEEPSQVHLMAGCGQSIASSSCMSGGSYLLDSASKKSSRGDLFTIDARNATLEENESLSTMGVMSLNQDSTTSGRISPETTTYASLPNTATKVHKAVMKPGAEKQIEAIDESSIIPFSPWSCL